MSKLRTRTICCVCVLAVLALWPTSFTSYSYAQEAPPPRLPLPHETADVTLGNVPSLESLGLASFSAVAIELPSGRIVAAQDADVVLPLASLTKLMTAVVALESHLALDQAVVVAPEDSSGLMARFRSAGDSISSLGLVPGESLRFRDLLAASLIASANNAAAGVARVSGLTSQQFVQHMNERAAVLGMEGAAFADPTGLDASNQASALDVAILARYAWANQTLRQLSGSPTYSFSTTAGRALSLRHTNPLTRGKQGFTVLASKTGYLEEAGYNLAMLARSSRGRDYLIVLLNAPTAAERTQDARTLLRWLEMSS